MRLPTGYQPLLPPFITLQEETAAYLAGPDHGEHYLIQCLLEALNLAHEQRDIAHAEALRAQRESMLCRRRLHDVLDPSRVESQEVVKLINTYWRNRP